MPDHRKRSSNRRHPLRPEPSHDPDARDLFPVWVWMAGAVLLLIVLAGAFGVSYEPIQPPCGSSCPMMMRAG
jgi:hypothetical protein